eukprot:12380028-Alexandrium_andersonii.AAC.1
MAMSHYRGRQATRARRNCIPPISRKTAPGPAGRCCGLSSGWRTGARWMKALGVCWSSRRLAEGK